MLGDLYAIDKGHKGLNDNHPTHLDHASHKKTSATRSAPSLRRTLPLRVVEYEIYVSIYLHNPTQQQDMADTAGKETHDDLLQTQAQNTTEPKLPPPQQTKPTPDTNPIPRKRPLNEIII